MCHTSTKVFQQQINIKRKYTQKIIKLCEYKIRLKNPYNTRQNYGKLDRNIVMPSNEWWQSQKTRLFNMDIKNHTEILKKINMDTNQENIKTITVERNHP